MCRKAFNPERIKKLHVDRAPGEANAANSGHMAEEDELLRRVGLLFAEDAEQEDINELQDEVNEFLGPNPGSTVSTHTSTLVAVRVVHKCSLRSMTAGHCGWFDSRCQRLLSLGSILVEAPVSVNCDRHLWDHLLTRTMPFDALDGASHSPRLRRNTRSVIGYRCPHGIALAANSLCRIPSNRRMCLRATRRVHETRIARCRWQLVTRLA